MTPIGIKIPDNPDAPVSMAALIAKAEPGCVHFVLYRSGSQIAFLQVGVPTLEPQARRMCEREGFVLIGIVALLRGSTPQGDAVVGFLGTSSVNVDRELLRTVKLHYQFSLVEHGTLQPVAAHA